MNTKAATLTQVDTLDAMSTPATVNIAAVNLRECMVLVDPELGTPLYWIDHRVRSARNSGNVTVMAHNLEDGRLETVTIGSKVNVAVIAA